MTHSLIPNRQEIGSSSEQNELESRAPAAYMQVKRDIVDDKCQESRRAGKERWSGGAEVGAITRGGRGGPRKE